VLTEIAYSVRITEKANQVNVEIGTRCAHNGLGGNVPIFGGFDCDLSDRQIFLLLRDFQNMLSFGGRALEMPIFEGKYDFLEAGLSDLSYAEIGSALTHQEYKEIAESFSASLNRLMSFFELPLQLIYWSSRVAVVKQKARYRCGVSPEDDSRDHDPPIKQMFLNVFEEATKAGGNELKFSAGVLAGLLGDQSGPGIPPAREGVEAVLAAMVMASYAAFETLAADLWVAALNRHTVLADNWADKKKDKQITMKDMSGYGWNLSKSAGTLLRQSKRISFESLNDIRQAYSQAFKGEHDRVFEECPELIIAEKTRHLFAHRGGLMDQKFIEQMKGNPQYASAAAGERLRLTGPIAGSHVAACTGCGISLLKTVDDWSLAQS